MYAEKIGEGRDAWAKIKAEVASEKFNSHINVATEDDEDEVEDGLGFLYSKSTNPRLHDQVEHNQLDPDHLYLYSTSYFHQMFDASRLDDF